jgi:hypothetical protein
MNKYSQSAQKTIEATLKKYEKGSLKNGKSGDKVVDRKQAVAIGISEAREKGMKVPKAE